MAGSTGTTIGMTIGMTLGMTIITPIGGAGTIGVGGGKTTPGNLTGKVRQEGKVGSADPVRTPSPKKERPGTVVLAETRRKAKVTESAHA